MVSESGGTGSSRLPTFAAASSRNDPCPCGSGQRYKHCHGALAASSSQAPVPGEAAWRHALEIDPRNAEAHFHLGNLLRERGEAQAAIVEYEYALESAPANPALLNNLGLALQAIGEHDRAKQCYRDALAANPQYADALANLASVLFEQEEYGGAVAAYDRFFSIRHDVPAAVWVRRAMAQQKTGALDDAEASFREAATRAPDDARIVANLGTLLVEARRYGDAEPALMRTLELDPRHGYAWSMLAHSRQHRCVWPGLEAIFERIDGLLLNDSVEIPANINPFTVLAMPLSPLAQLRAAQRWAAGLVEPGIDSPRSQHAPIAQRAGLAADGRLRVGFVSSDFRDHALARITAEFFETIDRRRIETFGYSLLPPDGSSLGQRVTDAMEHFSDVSRYATADIAQQIRREGIAVLFDLNGYTVNDRTRLFSLRPAPIQINWLGYLATSGADWIDYVITDSFTTPPQQQIHFSERLLHLEHCLFPGDTRRGMDLSPPPRSECSLPKEAFVFCCFNNQYKILPDVFTVWMRLLAQVAGSVLWLSPASDEAMRNLQSEASRRDVDPSRLVFAPRVPPAQHLARHRHADLFLDTTPYNAGVTANDALWMGVPVITCAGETMASRIAGSQLHAIGLPELVTHDLADYEATARRLALDPNELAAMRARLVANRNTHPLFDIERFTRGFEDALFRIATSYD